MTDIKTVCKGYDSEQCFGKDCGTCTIYKNRKKHIKRNKKDCEFIWFNGLIHKCTIKDQNCLRICNQFHKNERL
jgi:hypothetical protein